MCYWSSSAGMATEVDFLLVRGGRFVAVEAKSGGSFTESWCKGLRAAAPLKGLQRRLIVYPRGPALRTQDGIEVLPFRDFADMLASGTL